MRGTDSKQEGMFSYVSPEARVPTKHPLRPIRAMVSEALEQMDRKFEKLYAQTGRPSIAPERLIRALLLQVLYSIRSERMLVEQLEYNLLFRGFVGLSVDEPVWDHSTFSKNRDRLFGADIARELFDAIVEQARMAGLLSDEHFSVDGTMIEAWASHKSFRPKDGSGGPPGTGGRNEVRDFHGEQRTNDTHASTTDPEARLYKKSSGTTAKLAYLGHAVSENRHGLIVAVEVTQANGTAERSAAVRMLKDLPTAQHPTLGADKGYDTRGFVSEVRKLNATPHVAQNVERSGGSAIDARTTRHAGYALSIKARKLIEESFGWAKDIGLLRRPKLRGRRKIEAAALLTFTGYNLVRMRNLLAAGFT
ncbi:MAG: IS5 family transposase [Pseudomonadota bacterium]|jgi:transposase|nr:IS5 family transposase [Pseudomonadota bacterium]